MKLENVAAVAVILGVVVAVSLWSLAQSIGVSTGAAFQSALGVIGVVACYLLGYRLLDPAGWSNPWPFLFPGLWFASWPVVIEKGTSTPEFMIRWGADLEFVWWATPGFRWLILAVLVALAFWVYRRANSYR